MIDMAMAKAGWKLRNRIAERISQALGVTVEKAYELLDEIEQIIAEEIAALGEQP